MVSAERSSEKVSFTPKMVILEMFSLEDPGVSAAGEGSGDPRACLVLPAQARSPHISLSLLHSFPSGTFCCRERRGQRDREDEKEAQESSWVLSFPPWAEECWWKGKRK